MEEKKVKVKSLDKALKVLECFSPSQPELGIAQIAETLGLYKGNVHNIVSTLEQMGYLEQNPQNKKYRLGMKLLNFTYTINSNLRYQNFVYDVISEIAAELSCRVYFAVPLDNKVFYLNNAHYPTKFNVTPYRIIIGETAPMYCTSLGKAMLAFLSPDEQRVVLDLPREKFTRNTIVEEDKLLEELEKIRSIGYAVDDSEHEIGIKCLGVPVISRGKVVAALSVSMSVPEFDDNLIPKYYSALARAANEIKSLF